MRAWRGACLCVTSLLSPVQAGAIPDGALRLLASRALKRWNQTTRDAAIARAQAERNAAIAQAQAALAERDTAIMLATRARSEAELAHQGTFVAVMRAVSASGNESASSHAHSRDELRGLAPPRLRVAFGVLASAFPDVGAGVVDGAWAAFVECLAALPLPSGRVHEVLHVHPVLYQLLVCAMGGSSGLRLWHEQKVEEACDWHRVIPDFSFTAARDSCISAIGTLFSLEAKLLGDLDSSGVQSENYGRKTVSARFAEALARGDDPSAIWTIVGGSDLRHIVFSRISSGAPAPDGTYDGAQPCPTWRTDRLELLGEGFNFDKASVEAIVAAARSVRAAPAGFAALVHVLRSGSHLARTQQHALLSAISLDGETAPVELGERLGSGGTSDVYKCTEDRILGAYGDAPGLLLRECAAKIPRHTSAGMMGHFENERGVLHRLEVLRCPHVPTSRLSMRVNMSARIGECSWPVLIVHPCGTPLATAIAVVATNVRARREIGEKVIVCLTAALESCHAAGVVHVDVRPENIVLVMSTTSAGEPRVERAVLVDWALSKPVGKDIAGMGQRHYAHDRVFMQETCAAAPWVDLVGAAYTWIAIVHGGAGGCRAPWGALRERHAWIVAHSSAVDVAAISGFIEAAGGGRSSRVASMYEWLRCITKA